MIWQANSQQIDEGSVKATTNSDAKATGKFMVVKRGKEAVIVITLRNGQRYEAPDFGAHVDNEDIQPGEDLEPRRVCASPNAQYFFVEKHIDDTTNVGAIYKREGQKLQPLSVDGKRFDEACVRYCCTKKHLDYADYTGLGRDVFLIEWRSSRVAVFDVASADNGFWRKPGDRSLFFRVTYDFAQQRFTSLAMKKPWR